MPKLIRPVSLAPVVIFATLSSCSNRVATYPASWTVRFSDGEPVRVGVVEFRSENGTCARAKLDAAGSFALGTFANDDGAPAGEFKVIVVQYFDAPPRNHVHTHSDHDEDEAHGHDHVTDARVASKFTDYATSPLRAKISADAENKFDFVVTYPQRAGEK